MTSTQSAFAKAGDGAAVAAWPGDAAMVVRRAAPICTHQVHEQDYGAGCLHAGAGGLFELMDRRKLDHVINHPGTPPGHTAAKRMRGGVNRMDESHFRSRGEETSRTSHIT